MVENYSWMHDYEIDTRWDTTLAHPKKLQAKAPP
jgi:hypothetical protein